MIALNDVDFLKFLLGGNSNDDINYLNTKSIEGKIPLNYACKNSPVEVVKLLLDNGANPNLEDSEGKISLHYVPENYYFRDRLEIAGLVLGRGASPNIQDKDGETPLHYCSSYDDTHIVELLVMCGANPNIKDKSGKKPLDGVPNYNEMTKNIVCVAACVAYGIFLYSVPLKELQKYGQIAALSIAAVCVVAALYCAYSAVQAAYPSSKFDVKEIQPMVSEQKQSI